MNLNSYSELHLNEVVSESLEVLPCRVHKFERSLESVGDGSSFEFAVISVSTYSICF